ncbi:conserved protein of unknown function [Shewanella benthica]|uniref:Uncharacterized protein n=1 Tax=Shewanella benthica TaxID=43661 RepID=A0A330M622_9GAMM|nr:hypothetical protein [Shewanella benthica]SQH77578.1 conserved protein of unknown function [Shewanella benthica]
MSTCIQTLIEKLTDTAQRFRLGQEAEASQRLKQCLDLLEPMLPNLIKADEILNKTPEMLAAQERHDWLALADNLEYELPMLLGDKQV